MAGLTGRAILILSMAGALTAASTPALQAGSRWEFEARLGGAWNAPLPIVFRQQGHDDVRVNARWRAEALKPPIYYACRLATWRGGGGWALDFTHDKLRLEDPPPEVRSFSISHGYNLVTVQRWGERGGWRYGAALGTVLAHPEGEIRGQRIEGAGGSFGGYHLAGPTAGVLAGRSRFLRSRLYATGEAMLTLSFARLPIPGGTARIPNLAAHVTVGLGWSVPR